MAPAAAHSGEISEAALKRAADAVQAVKSGHAGSYAAAPARTNAALYGDENPLGAPDFEDKVKLLQTIDACLESPGSTVVAVHLEALDHCPVTRKDLRKAAEKEGIPADRLRIPEDGEVLDFS